MKTVVGLFDSRTLAQSAINELLDSGCQRDDINIMASDDERQRWMGEDEGYFSEGAGKGLGKNSFLSGGFSSLTTLGIEEQDAQIYAEDVSRGGVLVAVSTDDQNAQKIAGILNRYGAIDIDQRRSIRQGVVDKSMQQSGEQWQQGQRPIDVEEQTRDEFRDRPFSSRENATTPLASQQPYVKEDVTVTGQSIGRDEVVADTVQRSDVDVQRPGSQFGQQDVSAMDDDEFMRHFSSTYGGERFDEPYRSAYHFAESESVSHPQLKDKEWFEVEEEVHRDWELSHPGTWNKVQEAIHFGWDRNLRHH